MSSSENDVRALYRSLIEAWNARDAAGMARLYAPDGTQVGFDGSHISGPREIEKHLAPIFANHPTPAFVTLVREVRALTPEVWLLRADAGMVPPGKHEINPAVNAVQTLIAIQMDGAWRIALFQNTPAAFHGRPEMVEAFTAELCKVLK